MTPYLRLLTLRVRRRFVSVAFGLPALAPAGIVVFLLVASRVQEHPVRTDAVELMRISCFVALLASLMVTSNLTAFLVFDERANGRARLLRLATVDGRPPVVAHLGLASALAAAGASVGLGGAGLIAVAWGLPAAVWLAFTLWTGAVATVAGPIGVWLGYLLPRTVAMVAVQVAGFSAFGVLASVAGDALTTGSAHLGAVGWVALAQLTTLLALPPLWRRTSASLW